MKDWTTFYGWQLTLRAKKGAILDADGKATQFEIVREWTAQPGEIITDRRGQRYSVRPDHSLRKI